VFSGVDRTYLGQKGQQKAQQILVEPRGARSWKKAGFSVASTEQFFPCGGEDFPNPFSFLTS